MVKATCIKKNLENNKIVSYVLEDEMGNQTTILANNLKNEIKAGTITVTNLTLTSDNRLISIKGKHIPIQATCIGKYKNRGEVRYKLRVLDRELPKNITGATLDMSEQVLINKIKIGELKVLNITINSNEEVEYHK